jgi:hypothetical protein
MHLGSRVAPAPQPSLLDRGWGKPGQGLEISGRLDLTAFRAGSTNLSERSRRLRPPAG